MDEFVFKDTRIIYSLVAEKFRGHESLPIFRKNILGHSDLDSQVVYNKVDVINEPETIDPIEFTTDLVEPPSKSVDKLSKFDGRIDRHPRRVFFDIHAYVKQALADNPDLAITQSFLTRSKKSGGAGFGRPAVKSYIEFVGFSK